jgi:hypothetical protein
LPLFTVAFAVTPFPAVQGHKILLKKAKSPYLLESSVVLSARTLWLLMPVLKFL